MAKGGAGASAPQSVGVGAKAPPGAVASGPGAPGNAMAGAAPPAAPGAGFDMAKYQALQQQVDNANSLGARGGPGSAAWLRQLPGMAAQLAAMRKSAPAGTVFPGMEGMGGGLVDRGGGPGMILQPGGGDQNAFSPQAATWVKDPNAGSGGMNMDAMRAMFARMLGGYQRAGPMKFSSTGDRQGGG